MREKRIPIIPTSLVILVGLVAGAGGALALRGGAEVTSQTDPCYGFGELLSTWTYTVTEPATDALSIARDLKQGEVRELRECRKSPLETFVIDGQTGIVVGLNWTVDEAFAYYEAHPEEVPSTKAREEFERRYEESFVPADVPADLTAGCDPDWVTTTFDGVGAHICHPADWTAAQDSRVSGAVGTTAVEVAVLGVQIESHNTTCREPALVQVQSGTAKVCALPLSGPEGQEVLHYGVTLPNGRNLAINIYEKATAEDEATALRVAANVEALP